MKRESSLADDYLVTERREFIAWGRGKDMDANGVRQLITVASRRKLGLDEVPLLREPRAHAPRIAVEHAVL